MNMKALMVAIVQHPQQKARGGHLQEAPADPQGDGDRALVQRKAYSLDHKAIINISLDNTFSQNLR